MKTVLITGASDGIGKELAYKYAQDGYRLVLAARSEEKLQKLAEELKPAPVIVKRKDLSDMNQVRELYEELKAESVCVDVLVNNAGFGLYGEFLRTSADEELNMIDLNIKSITLLAKLFAPDMAERGSGHILNVASTAAFQPGPLMAVYYATKAYVLSFSEAIENELKGTGVSVSVLCPGPTKTGFSDRANLGQSKLFKSGVMDVKEVADAAYKGLHKKKTVIIPGLKNKMLAAAVRFMPRKTVTGVVRKTQERA
ncbi:SDR family NAD(P)-dependent oxidoreductase [Metabacillus indicus]|uniref:Short-chain dehydrogenase n=1 Tax=Metabacillus indicus TaxID=246786 RepID=A0A084GNU4_METID|nr:SDR family oxidoreductase [Metabacillus indicus]KEZ49006.1 short-chain dehydrogenase [Metabacillus indicus]KEZ49333.1 short-chain dehydrogenase [Metabacillus indicus LMG 22858]